MVDGAGAQSGEELLGPQGLEVLHHESPQLQDIVPEGSSRSSGLAVPTYPWPLEPLSQSSRLPATAIRSYSTEDGQGSSLVWNQRP